MLFRSRGAPFYIKLGKLIFSDIQRPQGGAAFYVKLCNLISIGVNIPQSGPAKATQINVAKFDSSSLNNQVRSGYEKFVNRALQQYAEAQAPSVMKTQGISRSEAIKYTRKKVASGGYKIYTTVNTGMQQQAQSISQSRYPTGSSVKIGRAHV